MTEETGSKGRLNLSESKRYLRFLRGGKLENFKKWLKSQVSNGDVSLWNGESLIVKAIEEGRRPDEEFVELLLEHLGSISDNEKTKVLTAALKRDCSAWFKKTLSLPVRSDEKGEKQNNDMTRHHLLFTALSRQKNEILTLMVKDGSWDLNKKLGSESALTSCIMNKNEYGLKILLENGAHPNGNESEFTHPLARALMVNQKMAEMLWEAGSRPSGDDWGTMLPKRYKEWVERRLEQESLSKEARECERTRKKRL